MRLTKARRRVRREANKLIARRRYRERAGKLAAAAVWSIRVGPAALAADVSKQRAAARGVSGGRNAQRREGRGVAARRER